MILTEKEKIILNIFLKENKEYSIKDLVALTKIKERTLYREIKNLEKSLENLQVKLLKEKSKYRLVGDLSSIDLSILDSSIEQIYSHDLKINLILYNLLINEEISIKEISEKLFISYNTVLSALNTIEKILSDYKLVLLRKKGQGLTLEGSIEDKKILLISIFCNEIDDNEFFYVVNNDNDYSRNLFIKFLDIDFLRNLFNENRQLEIFKLYTDSSIKKLLIAVDVAVKIDNYNIIDKEILSENEKDNINTLLALISKYRLINDKENFINYMAKILKTCKLIEQVTYVNDKYSYTLIYKVHSLIRNVSNKSHIDFSKDTNLANGLIAHIESAIKRHQLRLVEENTELLDFVLKNYNELYLIIKSELLKVFDEINFSSAELSYIVIHFASSYEQIYRENFIRALVVCSSGIGSSRIVGSLIRKNIPEIKNIEYSTPAKLRDDSKKNFDIIISTIRLDDDIDYVLIPTILREEDVAKIRSKLLEARSFKNIAYEEDDVSAINFIEKLMPNIYQAEYSKKIENIKDALGHMLASLAYTDRVKLGILNNLVDRHIKSSVVIPETRIALFHTLDNSIEEPFIKIVNLKQGIEMNNALYKTENVELFFIMVSPNISDYTDLLGQLSIAILEDEVFKSALFSRNIEFIKTKIELILMKYIASNN
ncbi:PTS sugar transporter subunit IIA [Gemella sp. zg-1178]|uniref:BglG family transcription antiterminator n=1 Tax=Gemella sp. zg-1178 TaxID=2840372 RepID=UPI00207B5207|nr:PTS sugar transporter subunit IIA [Gemella sp. zg-1178]